MGDPANLKAIPASHPPGFHFLPTEEQLFSYYLSYKNNFTSVTDVSPFGFDVIKEIDLYNYSPFDLPEIAGFPSGNGGNKKRWYCFTARAVNEQGKRKARGGFWKIKGRARDVVSGKEKAVLGTRKAFVFYRVDSSRAVKTDWFMYEYSPIDRQKDSFVLCRVFVKSCSPKKRLEHAEESAALIHNNGVPIPFKQHDGAYASGIYEVVVYDDNNVETNNEMPMFPIKLMYDTDNAVEARPVYYDALQSPVDVPHPNKLVTCSAGITSGSTAFGDVVAEEQTMDSTILLEDFIELDDLVEPLFCSGSSG